MSKFEMPSREEAISRLNGYSVVSETFWQLVLHRLSSLTRSSEDPAEAKDLAGKLHGWLLSVSSAELEAKGGREKAIGTLREESPVHRLILSAAIELHRQLGMNFDMDKDEVGGLAVDFFGASADELLTEFIQTQTEALRGQARSAKA